MEEKITKHNSNKWLDKLFVAYENKELSKETFISYINQNLFDKYSDGYQQCIEDSPIKYQSKIKPWLIECFGNDVAFDKKERNARFLEEALELVQSLGCSKEEAQQLVAYVYNRPIGEPYQEVGGVMVTLAALCLANNLDMHDNGETELKRIWEKVDVIREKQLQKPKYKPAEPIKEIKEKYIPKTLDEALDYLLEKIPEDQKRWAKLWTKEEFMGKTHMFLGMNIRNDWKLWFNDEDNELTTYFTSLNINHGDDRSGIILDSLYNKMMGRPLDIEKQVARYIDYWKKSGIKDGIIQVPLSTEKYIKKYKQK